MAFQKAVKSQAKLRLAIAGPSGSGKTYTSLAIASALGGDIAYVDTEHGSASKYADQFSFDVMEMEPPFHPDRFAKAIKEASEAGYKVIVLDSMTHAWNGTGGMLDIVEEISKRMKNPNSFAAWKDATPVQNRLIDAIVSAPIHVIVTMRSKQEYILQDSGNGKQVPRKVGMAPQQRDGFEYEFDVFLDMDIENNAIVSKTRCPALTGRVFAKPGKDIASILLAWLEGAPAPERKPQSTPTSNGNGNGHTVQANNPFDDDVPEVVRGWATPADAQAWAVEIGASENEHAARNAFKAVVERVASDGKLTRQNMMAVFTVYYHDRMKRAQEKALAAIESLDDVQEMSPEVA